MISIAAFARLVCERVMRDRGECCGYRMVCGNHLGDVAHDISFLARRPLLSGFR
jgi:hypothetical protein